MRIIARLNIGGPAQHVLHLSRELAGTHPTLLVTGEPESNEAELHELGEGVHLYRVPELGRSVRLGKDAIAFFKVYWLLRKIRPQIVHTHTAKAGAIGRLAAFIARVPIRVHTYHGHVFEGYFGASMSAAIVWFERCMARISTCIIAISQSQADDFVGRFKICKRSKVRVVPLGLDLERFRDVADKREAFRRELGVTDATLVTAVGRLVPIKNHGLLIRAAAQLQDANVAFAIVGGGEEEAYLRDLADQLGVGDRVQFTGWRHDLTEVYAGSDLVVLTSLNEGTPVCLIEALSAGVPVIASDVGGVRDLLHEAEDGTLFRSGDVDGLVGAIRTAAATRRSAIETRKTSNQVIRRYSVSRLVQDIHSLYGELLNRARKGLRNEVPQPSYKT